MSNDTRNAASCGCEENVTAAILPGHIVVYGDIMTDVIVVRLLRFNRLVASLHHDVAFLQKHLTDVLLWPQKITRV